MSFGLGLPLNLLSFIGLIYAIVKRRPSDIILLSFFIPYFLIVGSWSVVFVRYLIPLFPIYCIFGAEITKNLIWNKNKIVARYFIFVFLLVLVYTSAFTLSRVNLMTDETMDRSSDWINKNLPEDKKIAVTVYHPYFNTTKFDKILMWEENETISWLYETDPDYVVISGMIYSRSYRDTVTYPERTELYTGLRQQELDYSLVKSFEPSYFNMDLYIKLDPEFESYYISPRIEVYKKNG